MKAIRNLRISFAFALLATLFAPKLLAQPFGSWDFNSGNLTATVGSPLTFYEGPGGATDLGTTYGSTTSFGIPDIAGLPAAVMRFPANTNYQGYFMPTAPANGGGGYLNQYTYILDVLYPASSSGIQRPLIQTYSVGNQYIVVDTSGGVGPAVDGNGGFNGPFVGGLLPNTWYRLGVVVSAGNFVKVYTNGVEMGSFGGDFVDGFYSLDPNAQALILGTTGTNAAPGYVNSIQLRDSALNAGQMQALGAATAAGIPTVIPPVPAFIDSRTPGVNATGVSEEAVISVVLNQGDTVVTPGSVKLFLDGTQVGTVTNAAPIYSVGYTVPPRLDPLSVHTLQLVWTDSVAGNGTNTWNFTVKNYQVVNLPAPFYFQDFDSLTEDPTPGVALPAGWTVQNQTAPGNPGFDLDDRASDSYKDWILVDSSRLVGWGTERTDLPTIIFNGTKLTTLTTGNLLWAESDARSGSTYGQFADLFPAPISCVGRSNVFVAFNSIYEQNNDNMDFMEYTVDNGAHWLPVLYMFQWPPDAQEPVPQIIYTNGVIDVGATFSQIAPSRCWTPDPAPNPVYSTNYGSFIKAPISTDLIPYIQGVGNDNTTDGKRIVVVRLAAADGQPNVQFRINANGTSSWFWGIDNFGLYEINTPVFTTQPANATVAAGGSATFKVVVSSPSSLGYQWQHAGANIANGGHYFGVKTDTLTIANADANDAGLYRCVATNADGTATSTSGNLTVVTVPTVTTQPLAAVVNDGFPVSFNAAAFGGLPLTTVWKLNGVQVGTGATYSIAAAHAANAGDYTFVANNSFGAVTSLVARLSVVAVPVTTDLVVHLKFDTDYKDSSGRGNNGNAVGAPTIAAGKIGSALQYTDAAGGVSANYITLDNPVGTHPTDLQMGANTSFSISFWYKVPPGNRSGDPALIGNKDWDSGGNTGFVLFNSGSGLQWVYTEVNDGVNANTRKDSGGTSPTIEDGNWHHCLVVYQRGGGGYGFVDGNQVKFMTLATPSPAGPFFAPTTIDNDPANAKTATATGAWNIGEDGSGLYSLHDGPGVSVTNALIDDVGIWRRALSAQEAQAIYTAGQAGQDLSQAVVTASVGSLSLTVSSGSANFTWNGSAGTRLQKTISLATPTWGDVPGTTGASSYSEPATNATAYYRLLKP